MFRAAPRQHDVPPQSIGPAARRVLQAGAAIAGLFALAGVVPAQHIEDPEVRRSGIVGEPASIPVRRINERIDPHTGDLSLTHRDLVLPGPSGFEIAVSRSYRASELQGYSPFFGVVVTSGSNSHNYWMPMGLGWSLGVAPVIEIQPSGSTDPMLRTQEALCRRSTFFSAASATTEAYILRLPGGETQLMKFAVDSSAIVSADGWKLTCNSSQVYQLVSPEGITYELGDITENQSPEVNMSLVLQTSRATDLNGNWYAMTYRNSYHRWTPSGSSITYTWRTRAPSAVSSSDGRWLAFEYNDGLTTVLPSGTFVRSVLTKVRSVRGEVLYNVTNDDALGLLRQVTLPDGSSWQYEYWPQVDSDPSRPQPRGQGWPAYVGGVGRPHIIPDEYGFTTAEGSSARLKKVTTPAGGWVSYEYIASPIISVWRNSFGLSCAAVTGGIYEFQPPPIAGAHHQYLRVKTRTSSDGGIWNYTYSMGGSGQYDTTEVNGPAGVTTYKHIGYGYFLPAKWASQPLHAVLDRDCDSGSQYTLSELVGEAWKVGLTVEEAIPALGRTVQYEWGTRRRDDLLDAFPTFSRVPLVGDVTSGRPLYDITAVPTYLSQLLTKRTIEDSATYTQTFSGYDKHGNPASIAETGPNGASRTSTRTYHVDETRNILNRLKDETVTYATAPQHPTTIVREFFGSSGLLRSETRDGVTTAYTYTATGDPETVTSPGNRVTTFSNYKRGIAQAEAQPESINISRVVSDAGDVTSETDGEGHTRHYTYDGLGRITSIDYPRGNDSTIVYTANSRTITRGSLVEVNTYDGFDRLTKSVQGGIATTYTYDPLGRMTFQSNPGDTIGTHYQYDALNRITQTTNSDGTYRSVLFGPASVSVRDERNNHTTYNYRGYGDPTSRVLMGIVAAEPTASVSITRGPGDLVTGMTQADQTRSFGYDGRKYLVSETHPETGTTSYERDAAGNMTARTIGGTRTSFAYDGHNRLVGVTYPDGTPSVTQVHTKTHRLRSVTSSLANRVLSYDDNDNLMGESLTIGSVVLAAQYSYDGNDRLATITYPISQRVVSYAPDALGRPTQVSGYANAVTFWPSDQVRQIDYTNGVITNYDQNSRLWPSAFHTRRGSVYSITSTYGYDAAGNLISIVDGVDGTMNRSLGYDRIDRLTSASGPWGSGTIGYNGVNNITSQALGSFNLSYAYDAQNRLSSVSGSRSASYAYDASGNLASAGGVSYVYDAVPNLRCANCGGGNEKTEYTYDGLRHRTTSTKAGVTTYELYASSGKLLAEYTPSLAGKLVEHIYLGDKRIAQRVSDQGPGTAISPTRSTVVATRTGGVTLTVNVGDASTGGTVTFTENGVYIGTAYVVNGQASIDVLGLTLGQHSVVVSYSGDAAHSGNTVTLAIKVINLDWLPAVIDLLLN